ncbi:MAG TPA: hypothetical protein VFP95_03195 [Gammaproteobacteria bacterium]|nr:hypothetical protein [Gammaproteobacteria bacterium]
MNADLAGTTNNLPPLYSTRQVFVAALLGGAFGGGWLLSSNFRAVKDQSQFKLVLFGSLLLSILIAIGVMWLPTDFSNNYVIPFTIAVIFAAWHFLKFDEIFTAHKENGGKQASWWKTIGISVAALPATLLLFSIVSFTIPILPVNHIEDGPNIIYYEGDATREDAENLAAFFHLSGVFNKNAVWNMTLLFPENKPNTVIIKLPYAGDIKGTIAHEEFKALRSLLSRIQYTDKDVKIYVQNIFGLTKLVISS